jgi:CheY-like chemotaxis protein
MRESIALLHIPGPFKTWENRENPCYRQPSLPHSNSSSLAVSELGLEPRTVGPLKKKTILLVEDESILAMSEKMQLEKYGYGVTTVSSGEKAVEAIQGSAAFDLILMDINLGKGIDGTEAAETILTGHDIPIVFLSSHSEPEVIEKTWKVASYGYVLKNSPITVLDASIRLAFSLHQAHRESWLKKENLGLALESSEREYGIGTSPTIASPGRLSSLRSSEWKTTRMPGLRHGQRLSTPMTGKRLRARYRKRSTREATCETSIASCFLAGRSDGLKPQEGPTTKTASPSG